MKVIYDHQIFSHQNKGGPSRYFAQLIKGLVSLNKKPMIIAPINNNIHLEDIASQFKKKFPLNINKNFLTKILNNSISKFYFKFMNYDLYHLTYYNECFNSTKPKVITVYDLIHEKFIDEFKLSSFPKKKIFENIDHFICISENTKKDLINYYGINEKKITTTYLANSLKFQTSKKFKLPKPFFLYVGSRKRYKNFTLLLKSYSLDEKIKKNFDIVCFGGGKLIREEINNIKDFKIDLSSIHQIEGSDKILSSLYSSAEALIYPSKYEGFGLPILEAMSLGCPVISSNTSSLPEVYGEAALNFNPSSSEELLDCIIKIINNNELKEAYIKKGYAREKIFSWKKCAVETNKIYQNLI